MSRRHRFARTRLAVLAAGAALLAGSPAAAQRAVQPTAWSDSRPAAMRPIWSSPRANQGPLDPPADRPPLTTGMVVSQSLAGAGGGLLGALAGLVPAFLLASGDHNKSTETAVAVMVVGGYYAGTAVGVQAYGRKTGMRGTWKSTLIGGAIGVIGGPLAPITIPLGAALGYDRTREYESTSR